VRVEGAASWGTDCATAIADRLGIVTVIEMVERGALPRAAYKAVRLVDA
jgi:hypothetical protein